MPNDNQPENADLNQGQNQQPPKDKPPKKPTADEEEVLTQFAEKFAGIEPAKKPAPKPKEKAEEAAEGGEGEGGEGKPAKPPEKPKKKPAPQQPPAYEKLVEAAAEGAARVLSKQTQQQPPPEKKAEGPVFAPHEERKMLVLQQMEKSNPEQYKGIADKYRKNLKSLMDYAAKWEQDNPGQKFDEDAQEHSEFIESMQLDWDDNDYTEAMVDLRAEQKATKAIEEFQQQTNNRLSEFERREALAKAADNIKNHQTATTKGFLTLIADGECPALDSAFNEDGSHNAEAITELSKQDPVAVDVVLTHFIGGMLQPLAGELYKIYKDLVPFDPRLPAHNWLNVFLENAQKAMLSLPPESQMDEHNRRFLPLQEYLEGFKTDPKGTKERFWTFDDSTLTPLLAVEVKAQAMDAYKMERKKYERWANANNIELPAKKNAQKPREEEEETISSSQKPKSPTSVTAPKMAGGGKGNAANAGDPLSSFTNRFLGQS